MIYGLRLALIISGFVLGAPLLSEASPSSSKSSSSAQSSSSERPKKKSCCFCVTPADGQKDAEKFAQICSACLPQKFPKCDVYASFRADQFDKKIAELQCDGPINVFNRQHGPNPNQALEIVRVCASAYPSCSIKLTDISCSSYGNEAEADKAIQKMQESLSPGMEVVLCGSVSDTVSIDCENTRIEKTYFISKSRIEENLGLCPAFGSPCRPLNSEYKCKDSLNRTSTIRCCSTAHANLDKGYWGNSMGCEGRGCDAKRCPSMATCAGDDLLFQFCSENSSSGVCLKHHIDCGRYGQMCRENPDRTAACVPRPSFSSSSLSGN